MEGSHGGDHQSQKMKLGSFDRRKNEVEVFVATSPVVLR